MFSVRRFYQYAGVFAINPFLFVGKCFSCFRYDLVSVFGQVAHCLVDLQLNHLEKAYKKKDIIMIK